MRSSYACDLYCFVCCCYLIVCCFILPSSYTSINYILIALGIIVHVCLAYYYCKPLKKYSDSDYIIIINPDDTMSLGVYSVAAII